MGEPGEVGRARAERWAGDGELPPLHAAVRENDLEAAARLIAASADVDQPADGRTPMFLAARERHVSMVRVLLEAGAGVDKARASDGVTPLLMASSYGHTEVANALIAAGADVDKARTDDGTTPLLLASWNGGVEVVAALIAAGADVDKACLLYTSDAADE